MSDQIPNYPPPPPAVQAPASQVTPQTSTAAVVSLVLGILSWITVGLTAIPAVIAGHVALLRMKRDGHRAGHNFAVVGLILGYIPVVGWIALWGFAIAGGALDQAHLPGTQSAPKYSVPAGPATADDVWTWFRTARPSEDNTIDRIEVKEAASGTGLNAHTLFIYTNLPPGSDGPSVMELCNLGVAWTDARFGSDHDSRAMNPVVVESNERTSVEPETYRPLVWADKGDGKCRAAVTR